ncbi:Hormone-sensitive lipase [Halotydeus destructor]|nr:Hormone-sensitive lipase [Halotydeus destructor]
MSLRINPFTNVDQLLSDLVDLDFKQRGVINCDHEDNRCLSESISDLLKKCADVAKFAGQYDFKHVQANGYWSCVILAIKLIKYGLEHFDKNDPEADINVQFRMLVDSFLSAYDTLIDVRDYSETEKPANVLQGDVDLSVRHFRKMVTASYEDGWLPLVDQFSGFYLESSPRLTAKLVHTFLPFLGIKVTEFFKCATNPDFRRRTLISMVQKFDTQAIRLLGMGGETPWNCLMLPLFLFGMQPNITRTVYIPRQKRYIIDYHLDRREIFLRKDCPAHIWGREPTRCRLLHNTSAPAMVKDTIILHCHGGGFVCGSPDSHEVYLRGWARDMPGVAIISVDHSLAPGVRFPVPSQQLLDTYLWLTSGQDGVMDMLGFHPKNVIMIGDSSGGLLMTSLTMILNDIRKQFQDGDLIMPKAIIGFYSSFSIQPLLTPSFMLATVHPFLLPAVFCSMADAYLPDGRKQNVDENGNITPDDDKEVVEVVPWWARVGNFFSNMVINVKFGWQLYKTTFSENDEDVWYLKDGAIVKRRLSLNEPFGKHPYLSPLNYDDFESLRDIKMHLVSMTYEPILDHSIMMARKWKGDISLDILDDLSHCWLNLLSVKGRYEEAYHYAVDKMRTVILKVNETKMDHHTENSVSFLNGS